MRRRDFFKMAAAAGLSITLTDQLVSQGIATPPPSGNGPYDGPLYLMIKADGGWDTTYLCDPKGGDINRLYGEDDIQDAGGIKYAPGLAPVTGGRSFFEKYSQDLLVINGINMSTNSHDPGKRYTWTGRLDNAGYPTFAALVSAIKDPEAALSHISFGYTATGGVVPLTRIERPNVARKLTSPYNDYWSNGSSTYHTSSTRAHIDLARTAREQLLLQKNNLPEHQKSMSRMFLSKLSLQDFNRLDPYLPSDLGGNDMRTRASIVMAAYQAGLCVSANLNVGGFDTHRNNDIGQIEKLDSLLQGIDDVMEYADTLGIRERIVLIIGSDFSRTPKYNRGDGKDHWSVGSMMCMGPGIRGGRVLGGTDTRQLARPVDPMTLKPSDAPDAIDITPEHIHVALRHLAGVHDHHMADQTFRIDEDYLDFFS